jgi:predicted CopG family antitoxin
MSDDNKKKTPFLSVFKEEYSKAIVSGTIIGAVSDKVSDSIIDFAKADIIYGNLLSKVFSHILETMPDKELANIIKTEIQSPDNIKLIAEKSRLLLDSMSNGKIAKTMSKLMPLQKQEELEVIAERFNKMSEEKVLDKVKDSLRDEYKNNSSILNMLNIFFPFRLFSAMKKNTTLNTIKASFIKKVLTEIDDSELVANYQLLFLHEIDDKAISDRFRELKDHSISALPNTMVKDYERNNMNPQHTETMLEVLKTTGETKEMVKLFIEETNKQIKKDVNEKKAKVVKKIGIMQEDQSVMLIFIESEGRWYYKYFNTNKVHLGLSPVSVEHLYTLMKLTYDKDDDMYKNESNIFKYRGRTEEQRDHRLRKELTNLLPFEFPCKPFTWNRSTKRYSFPNIIFKFYSRTYEERESTTDFTIAAGNPSVIEEGLSEYDEE